MFNLLLDIDCFPTCNESISKLLFNGKICSMTNVSIEITDGLLLTKSFISHQILTNINLILQIIDDLYVLLDGLVPNVQIMIIQLCQSRILYM
jgi:hypothetical protein